MITSPEIDGATFSRRLVIIREAVAVKRDGARVEAILAEDYSVGFLWDGGRWTITVPKGFQASPSVPPRLHGLVPFWGALFEASIVHDWCYWTRLFDPHAKGDGRELADHLFYALMRAGGTSIRDALKAYTAVRAFGRSRYRVNSYKAENGLRKVGT